MLLLFFYFLKFYYMCLVVIQGEIKKSCCNCGGLCKREQKWAEKMSRLEESNESVDHTVLLREAQSSQYQPAIAKVPAHYEESNHFRLR
jgi:hypothetical protein